MWSVLNAEHSIIVTACIVLAIWAVRIWNLFDAHKSASRTNPECFETERKQIKDAWLAFFLADIIPGLGQMYVRKWLWGAVFMATSVPLLLVGMKSRLLAGSLWAVFSAAVCFHAYVSARTRRERSNKVISIVATVIFCSHLSSGCYRYAFKAYLVEAFRITAESMRPTLIPGDRLLVRKNMSYVPKRDDIVVFKSPNDPGIPWIKRIAALPDETVEIAHESLFINGCKVPYRPIKSIEHFNKGFGLEKPYKVPANHIFIIGDNTTNSEDSRSFGAIPVSDVIGRVYKIYWPLGRIGPIE
jgi:signal peptidase I